MLIIMRVMKINHLQNIRVLSKLLDNQFSVFGFKFGLDPVLGIIPGLGDLIALIMGIYIVYSASHLGLPQTLVSKMWTNVLLDLVLGAIPGIGDVVDFFFKSNMKNLDILEKFVAENRVEEGEIVG
jgi:hypothetical protein